jgi:biotin carboxylase
VAHLLVLELPGGNDSDVLQAAVERGDAFTFLTAQLDHYTSQPQLKTILSLAKFRVEVSPFVYDEVEKSIFTLHAKHPFDAVLCLLDTRMIDASRLAHALHLPFLNRPTTELLRDKFSVRQRLKDRGLPQPGFALARSNDELKLAVEHLGLPVLIKPTDGYGSQNIVVLRFPEDLDPYLTPLDDMLPSGMDYGLGVKANDQLLVERYLAGTIVGCDTFSFNGRHQLLGVNEKLFFEAPSFAIRGGCFQPNRPEFAALERYVFSLLDAVNFDYGAAHVEIILTDTGPQLIEINARLVGAKLPRLMSFALGQSVYAGLIDLHLGLPDAFGLCDTGMVAVTRWIVAEHQGWLVSVTLPARQDERIRCVEILKVAGDFVRPPTENSDRIGYVMVCAPTQSEAEGIADKFIAECVCVLKANP